MRNHQNMLDPHIYCCLNARGDYQNHCDSLYHYINLLLIPFCTDISFYEVNTVGHS